MRNHCEMKSRRSRDARDSPILLVLRERQRDGEGVRSIDDAQAKRIAGKLNREASSSRRVVNSAIFRLTKRRRYLATFSASRPAPKRLKLAKKSLKNVPSPSDDFRTFFGNLRRPARQSETEASNVARGSLRNRTPVPPYTRSRPFVGERIHDFPRLDCCTDDSRNCPNTVASYTEKIL